MFYDIRSEELVERGSFTMDMGTWTLLKNLTIYIIGIWFSYLKLYVLCFMVLKSAP